MKPLSEYYKHAQMGDGHLNKCKCCTKKDVKDRANAKSKDVDWVESEKKRARDKYYRLGYNKKHRPSKESSRARQTRYKSMYPEKYKAHIATNNMKPETKGNHLHHWSYREEHAKDVIELTPKRHSFLHRYMKYDQEQMMYRVSTNVVGFEFGELIDTKAKHLAFLTICLREKEF